MITFAQALEAANVEKLYVLGYGIKMPLSMLSKSLVFHLKPFEKCNSRDDNIKLKLRIYPHVLHYLRQLFTSKPLIPKTYKGMKAKESLLICMLNDIE